VKRLLIASAVILPAAVSQQILAPDIAAAQSPGTNWSGFHVGFSGGGGTGQSSQTDNYHPPTTTTGPTGPTGPTAAAAPKGPTGPTGPTGPSGGTLSGFADGKYNVGGALLGAGLGYNWQYQSWVFGLETDLAFASIDGSSQTCGISPHQCGTKLDSLGTLRMNLGPSWDRYWLYATGGLAYGEVHAWDSAFGVAGSNMRTGWTAGVGIQAMLMPNWSVKFEYLHVDLGTATQFDIVANVPERVSYNADIFRVGVTYQFNGQPDPTPPRMWTK
jgi:outer membrane immunogenic protein